MPQHLELPAAADVSSSQGVAKYQLDLQPQTLTMLALDSGGQAVTTVRLHGVELDSAPDAKSVVRDPSSFIRGKASHMEASGRWGRVQLQVGGAGLVSDLPKGNSAMLDELQAFGSDLAQQSRAQHAGRQPGQLQAEAIKVMDGICYIAGIGCGFWPIGTLIFGPTCVGCAIYYFFLE